MQLFYLPQITASSKTIDFDKEESRHIVKVLRKEIGDKLHITNGKGYFFTAEIVAVSPNKCTVSITGFDEQPPLPYRLHLAVAPTKLNDRYEWFLEKAVEIGVTEITPVFCDHSERKKINHERYEKIILSAMKQSLKAFLPKLNKAVSFSEFIKLQKTTTDKKYIAHCAASDRKSLKSQLQPGESVLILIGPEGDFSEKEIKTATTEGFIPVTLGESRLRTETAAIAACHSVAFVNG